MNVVEQCPHCGTTVSPETLMGLCPDCMLQAGLETGATGEGRGREEAPSAEALSRYFPQLEILELLGRGGMGAVYKARQKELDRLVALKILPPAVSRDPSFAERFTREARALAKLSHPYIVTLYEFGRLNGETTGSSPNAEPPIYYFLMEFVDGVNLRELLRDGGMAPTEALAILPQVCDAVQYAHDRGIVHRDIKPANILLSKSGGVKIADFGVAKIMAEGAVERVGEAAGASPSALTGAHGTIGTPKYMAPEQVEHPTEVDHRADIYSLGVVLYQMLTGELPGEDFAPPSQKAPVDARMDQIVMRALEKDPRRRYQHVSALNTELKTLRIAAADSLGKAGGVGRNPNPRRARRLGLYFAAAGLILSCLALGWWGWKAQSRGPQQISYLQLMVSGECSVLLLMFSALGLLSAACGRSKSTEKGTRMNHTKLIAVRLTVLAGSLAMAVGVWHFSAQAAETSLAQDGWKLSNQHRYEDAAAKFRQAVKASPKNTDAWNGLGWATFNGGKPDEAEKAFKKVISLEPAHPAALNGLGQLYLARGDYAAAETNLLKAAPQASAAWYGLARLYLLQGKYEQAEKWAQKIVDSGEADDGAQQMLKAAQARQLNDKLRREIAPPAATPPVKEATQRAWKLMNQGQRVEARKLLEAELKKNPNDPDAQNALGWCLLNGGDAEGAKPHFEKAVALDSNAAGAMNGLARVYKIEGKVDEAIKLWQQMCDRFPGPHAGVYGLAMTWFERKEYEKALPLLEQLAKAYPKDQDVQTKLARARAGGKAS